MSSFQDAQLQPNKHLSQECIPCSYSLLFITYKIASHSSGSGWHLRLHLCSNPFLKSSLFLSVILRTCDQCPHHIDTSWLCSLSLKVLGGISKLASNYRLTSGWFFLPEDSEALATMESFLTIIAISGETRFLTSGSFYYGRVWQLEAILRDLPYNKDLGIYFIHIWWIDELGYQKRDSNIQLASYTILITELQWYDYKIVAKTALFYIHVNVWIIYGVEEWWEGMIGRWEVKGQQACTHVQNCLRMNLNN